jgi:hypothetical protein
VKVSDQLKLQNAGQVFVSREVTKNVTLLDSWLRGGKKGWRNQTLTAVRKVTSPIQISTDPQMLETLNEMRGGQKKASKTSTKI